MHLDNPGRVRLTSVAHSVVLAVGIFAWAPSALGAPDSARTVDREALRTALKDVIARSALRSARTSVQVQSLADGAVIFSQNADELLNPASNVKLVTAAAALSRLGIEYRFDTEFLTEPSSRGRTLYVRGKGDPTLTTERLYGIVSELLHAGLRDVNDIVVDDAYFDTDRQPPGFDQENGDRAYLAPPGAVSLNSNTVGVYLRPGTGLGARGTVEVEPPSDFFVVDSQLTTGTKEQRRYSVFSTVDRDGQRQKLTVRGTVPNDRGSWAVWKKIDNPPLYVGATLRSMLAERGVQIHGKVKVGVTPASARMLYVAQSETLDIVLKRLNKHSSNFVAEQLIKTLGAEGKGLPGTSAKGVEVVEEFLEREVGIPRGSYVMKNGSGLNDTNRFSSAQLNRILRYMMDRFSVAPEYISSVGVAGKDGTLKYRFEGSDAVGRLRAKTGTLENASALAGYIQSVGGEMFTFSVMVNDFPGRAGTVVQHIDALGAAVAAYGSVQGPARAVASMMTQPNVVGSLAEASTRIATYLALAKEQSKRNIAFLRTAWRSEKDPVVRAVVADALYQSDPEDYLGTRILLDSYSASEEVYGRLRAVAATLKIPVPGVTSLLELSATGNLEALKRMLEVARASPAENQAEMGASLADVARTAPDELLLALKASPEAERQAGTALLAAGLVKVADAAHPFWPALRKGCGAPDPELSAFCKRLEITLSLKIAEAKAPAVQPSIPAPVPAPVSESTPRPGG